MSEPPQTDKPGARVGPFQAVRKRGRAFLSRLIVAASRQLRPAGRYLAIFRNGTVLPGTMVEGSTPFHFSAATRVGRLGLLRRASPRAWMAPASALPWTSIWCALASAAALTS